MKTLILEEDPVRARSWMSRYDSAGSPCHLARSPAEARLMLVRESYDRLCFRFGIRSGAGRALLPVARTANPFCEIVDLVAKTRRSISGPKSGGVLRLDSAVDVVSL